MKIHFLKSGVLEAPYNQLVADNSRKDEIIFPVTFYLEEHPDRNVLIDGGNACKVVKDPVRRKMLPLILSLKGKCRLCS